MSISKPQNRDEFKKHILIKLGEPVLEINVSDEQMDIAIDDAFQYFNERNHFNGIERIYLTVDINAINGTFGRFYYEENKNEALENQLGYEVRSVSRRQSNFIILPDDIVGVEEILRPRSGMGIGGGIIPPGMIYPGIIGNLTGQNCDANGFGLTTLWAFQEFKALLDFMFFPPKMYNFNQRTHRLWIDGDMDQMGGMMVLQCMAKPNPDIFPDLYNDMWLKNYATALVKMTWGQNLTKYNQVQLPGGITLNGDRILTDAQNEVQQIRERFSMDYADPPLDAVG